VIPRSTALNAIFSLCAIALDSSYAVPVLCKVLFHDHPEVQFKPGPFSLGTGLLGKTINLTAVTWVRCVRAVFAVLTCSASVRFRRSSSRADVPQSASSSRSRSRSR